MKIVKRKEESPPLSFCVIDACKKESWRMANIKQIAKLAGGSDDSLSRFE